MNKRRETGDSTLPMDANLMETVHARDMEGENVVVLRFRSRKQIRDRLETLQQSNYC